MITFKPLKLSLWLFIGGLSFGMALNWGWLVLLGLASPLLVGGCCLLMGLIGRN